LDEDEAALVIGCLFLNKFYNPNISDPDQAVTIPRGFGLSICPWIFLFKKPAVVSKREINDGNQVKGTLSSLHKRAVGITP
jgi:hypothetical protein